MQKTKSMSLLSSGAFWGAIIVIFGLSIILKEVFHISFPIMRVLFGVFLIYMGVRVIAGGFGRHGRGEHNAIFNSTEMQYDSETKEYNIIFGSGNVDLTTMRSLISNEKIEVNVVFGNGVIYVNNNLPVRITTNTVFGNSVMPSRSTAFFGEMDYTSPTYQADQPHLFIEANAVFGKVEIVAR